MKTQKLSGVLGLALLAVGTSTHAKTGEGGASTVGGGGHSVASAFQETQKFAYIAFEQACDSKIPAEICAILDEFGSSLLHVDKYEPARGLKGPDGEPREAWTENRVIHVDVDKLPALLKEKDGIRRYVRLAIHEVCVNGELEEGDSYSKCSNAILDLLDERMMDLNQIAKTPVKDAEAPDAFRAEAHLDTLYYSGQVWQFDANRVWSLETYMWAPRSNLRSAKRAAETEAKAKCYAAGFKRCRTKSRHANFQDEKVKGIAVVVGKKK